MKNSKNTLFVVTAALAAGLLAALLSGCDGSGTADENNGDAGRADARRDVVANGDAKQVPCKVPEPKLQFPGVGSNPAGDYQVITYPVVCDPRTGVGIEYAPTNCEDPVDGFSTSLKVWCCVYTGVVGDYGPRHGDVVCSAAPVVGEGTHPLCDAGGTFVGWGC